MIYLLLTLISRNSRLRGINSRLGLKKFPSRMATGIGLQVIGLACVFRSRMGGGIGKIAKIPGSTGITGNLGQAGWRRGRRAISEVFFSGAIAAALGHHARAVRDAGGVGECDVKSMLAFTRAIAHQCRRRAQANQIGARRRQPGGACP